jgi:ferric-dicitrate binding protein FerR (iron transport regulator)
LSYDSTHIDNLIARYLAGETSEKEWEELSLWMETSTENKKYFEGIKFVHDKAVASHRIVKVDVNKAWSKLSSQMATSAQASTPKTITLPVYKRTWLRVAATFAIFLTISAVLYFVSLPKGSEHVTLVANDSVKTQTLAGNTEITLNRNSKIIYNAKKSGKQQEIELTGEAFIEVNHGKDTTLIVKAGETMIRDIGTSFNVKAYSVSATIEVLVQSGEVAFYTAQNAGISVKAGESGIYNKQEKKFYKPGAVDINAIAYKSKLFIFREIPLVKAISSLNKVYSQKFELANINLENCTITVTFDNETPAGIADIIAETLGLQLTEAGDRFILSGECSRQP